MFIYQQCEGRFYSDRNPGQPRKIMCIIVKIMRIIVLEDFIRLLSLLYACLVVNPVELAFFIDTYQSFLSEWAKNCCLDNPIFQVQTPCHN